MEKDKLYKEVDNKDGTITLTPKNPDFGKIYPFGKHLYTEQDLLNLLHFGNSIQNPFTFWSEKEKQYPTLSKEQILVKEFINSLNKT